MSAHFNNTAADRDSYLVRQHFFAQLSIAGAARNAQALPVSPDPNSDASHPSTSWKIHALHAHRQLSLLRKLDDSQSHVIRTIVDCVDLQHFTRNASEASTAPQLQRWVRFDQTLYADDCVPPPEPHETMEELLLLGEKREKDMDTEPTKAAGNNAKVIEPKQGRFSLSSRTVIRRSSSLKVRDQLSAMLSKRTRSDTSGRDD